MKFLYILGFLWALPMSIFAWMLILVLYFTKQIEKSDVSDSLTFIIDLKNSGWFCKKAFTERGWFGFVLGNTIFLVDIDDERYARALRHEQEHVYQMYKCGIFFFALYIIESLRIYMFVKEEHSYYDNWFEVEARRAAGQPIQIPKSFWKDDRWIWW